MNSSIDFQIPVPVPTVVILIGSLACVWISLRLGIGRIEAPARRWPFVALRLLVIGTLLALLSGPVRVDESPGEIRRREVFYLLDSSRSMAIGREHTRWDVVQQTVRTASTLVKEPERLTSVRSFRFGHRLAAISEGSDLGPIESDTRLSQALRQLSGRFGSEPPVAVVLFSDGRVRDTEAVERLAGHYRKQNIPIHVVPVGELGHGGDVALVSVVSPKEVRKYSDVEVQVFFRSFGYTGQRTEVQLVVPADGNRPEEMLTSMPVTLRGGAQSVTLKYFSDTWDRKFEVRIPEQKGELSNKNNVTQAEVGIDQTKTRVLYIEGRNQPLERRINETNKRTYYVGPHSRLRGELARDEGIECIPLVRSTSGDGVMRADVHSIGFPGSIAELSGFDCVILSDTGFGLLTEEHQQWLEDWVSNRGGSLCMIGGPGSFGAGRWHDSPVARMLPVTCEDDTFIQSDVIMTPTDIGRRHSIFHIVPGQQQNDEVLQMMPPFSAFNKGLKAKLSSTVIAKTTSIEGETHPMIVAGNYGRGRTLAIAAPATIPEATKFLNQWRQGTERHSNRFWRNVVYWLSESSAIGRRRLLPEIDKQFYRLGDTIQLRAVAYDETSRVTTNYSVWAMIEPRSLDFADGSFHTPIRWPNGVARESGEEGPLIAWGEEIQMVKSSDDGEYRLPLELASQLASGGVDEGLRIEMTAYESTGDTFGFSHGTQVDSTSLEIQILDDPFEQQNPFPNHELLSRIASESGGRVLSNPAELAQVIDELPVETGSPIITQVPIWNRWWILISLVSLLTIEWGWRRAVGMA